MPRAKRGTKGRARHKKVMKLAKGNVGGRRKLYRAARETVEKGLTYAQLINGLKKGGIAMDRKVLADLAMHDPTGFNAIAEIAKAQLAA